MADVVVSTTIHGFLTAADAPTARSAIGVTDHPDLSEVQAASANWDSTYTTVQAESAGWGGGGSGGGSSFTLATVTTTPHVQVDTDTHHNYDTTSAEIAVTLLPVADHIGVTTHKKIAGANNVVLTAPNPALIDGQATYTIVSQYESISIYTDGTDYFIQ